MDTGAGVRFVRIFRDTANNTWNPTQVSESDMGAGYPTQQKKIKTRVSGYNTDNHATPAYMTQAGRQTFAPDLKFDRTTEPLKF